MCFGERRPQPNCRAKLGRCFVQQPALTERKPERQVRFGREGFPLDSLPEFAVSRTRIVLRKPDKTIAW